VRNLFCAQAVVGQRLTQFLSAMFKIAKYFFKIFFKHRAGITQARRTSRASLQSQIKNQ
jgi:hypothetical protein